MRVLLVCLLVSAAAGCGDAGSRGHAPKGPTLEEMPKGPDRPGDDPTPGERLPPGKNKPAK